jgi:hypothetical protein
MLSSLKRVGLAFLVVIGSALAIGRPWTTWCPTDWSGVSRVDLAGASGDVILGGRPFRIGGGALLDYGLHTLMTPLDGLLYTLRGDRHPLAVTASISASSRDALGDSAFTCFRAIRGTDVWARRPTTYPTQTMADGYPPGAQLPANNEAWRRASATDGPEWPEGGSVSLELWVSANGQHYIFVLAPFALMRGG